MMNIWLRLIAMKKNIPEVSVYQTDIYKLVSLYLGLRMLAGVLT